MNLTKKLRGETGQSMVLVAFMFLAMIGLAALVIDGGYAYWQRRIAQNAADAGALAGATALCSQATTTLSTSDQVLLAKNKAVQYINSNQGIGKPADITVSKTNASVTQLSFDTVDALAYARFDTFFGNLIGYKTITVTATARASCSPAVIAEGPLPISWSCKAPLSGGVITDTVCTIAYQNNIDADGLGDTCEYGDDPYYIVADSNKTKLDVQCAPAGGGSGSLPAGSVDCDTNDDGVNDLSILDSGGDRVWLDLTGKGAAADIQNWIQYGFPGNITLHTWYPEQSGNIDVAYQAVKTYRLGETVAIPVYDSLFEGDPSSNANSANWHAQDIIVGSPTNSLRYYHVTSIAAFHIDCVHDSGSNKDCPGYSMLVDKLSGTQKSSLKTIEGCFSKAPVPGLRGAPGTNPVDSGAYSVTLVK